jgi:hypothetical protein
MTYYVNDHVTPEILESAGKAFVPFGEAAFPIKPHPTWFIIDSTKIKAYLECPRKYFFEYILGWKQGHQERNDLAFGRAAHLALEILEAAEDYDSDVLLKAFRAFEADYRKDFSPDTDALFEPKTPDRFLTALPLYCNQWRMDKVEADTLQVEFSGLVGLTPDFNIYYKMDTKKRRRDNGKIFSREHKTKKGLLSRTWRDDFQLSVQIGTYHHVLYCLHPVNEVAGVEVNGLGFKTTKAALFEFDRLLVFKSPTQMRIWHNCVCNTLGQLHQDMALLTQENLASSMMHCFHMNVSSCTKYWGCPFLDYCNHWPNPLAKAEQVPLGFHEEFWDPSDQTEGKINLTGDWITEGN